MCVCVCVCVCVCHTTHIIKCRSVFALWEPADLRSGGSIASPRGQRGRDLVLFCQY